jgi:hypothetical protein
MAKELVTDELWEAIEPLCATSAEMTSIRRSSISDAL